MTIKILVALFVLLILYSLGSSLIFLVRDQGKSNRTVKRLTWRIGLSLVLFLMLWGAHHLGWIKPNTGAVVLPVTSEQATPD